MRFYFGVALLLLAGCSTLDIARTKGAEAYDEALNASITFTCNDTSVGSVVRRFGTSADHMEDWVDFCFGDRALPYLPELLQPPAIPVTTEGELQ